MYLDYILISPNNMSLLFCFGLHSEEMANDCSETFAGWKLQSQTALRQQTSENICCVFPILFFYIMYQQQRFCISFWFNANDFVWLHTRGSWTVEPVLCSAASDQPHSWCVCSSASMMSLTVFTAAVIVIVIVRFFLCSGESVPFHAYSPGDIIIGGLFPIHRQTNQRTTQGPLSCSM